MFWFKYFLVLEIFRTICFPVLDYGNKSETFNPLTPEDFYVFEWFSAFTRPIGFRDSIFKVTIESAAVIKH